MGREVAARRRPSVHDVLLAVPDVVAVALSSVAFAVLSVAVGWSAARWPLERLGDGPVTGLRRWEDGGRSWHRWLRVRRWKDRLPEAGALFGGLSKRLVPSRRTEDLLRFRAETVRAERVHLVLLALTPVHALWCRPTVFAGMAGFGVVANVPFIVVQRFNRGALDRVLARRQTGTVRPAQRTRRTTKVEIADAATTATNTPTKSGHTTAAGPKRPTRRPKTAT